ncbi:hypothetical protein CHS0354_023682 [Potamilus streckersoni]|uniref:ABC transporter domain-containing protein n=1 Tax=Potamilus streckersoni TaxID=2493646 RepID=A0AAE0SBN6_9BIVA|nr:hypothetical protein CHS0354_023682 [Potamilus streckersoni]
MGALSQLLRLFWKNYILRKRQPLELLLELVWPVLIFGIVAIIRSGIPPQSQSACSYYERAMPSAGMIPFLQSSVCTLNNPCKTPEQLVQTKASQQKLSSFLSNLQPYLTNSKTLDALEAFHTVEKVFDLLKNVSENGTVLETFQDKLKLKNLFKDPNEIYSILVNDFKVLSDQEARALLDGNLNILEISDMFGNENSDFEAIVCNITRLQMYIVFSSSADVSDVSRSLCSIDKNMISNITNIVVKHINVANMINIAADFAAYTGRFEYSSAISDIGKLVEYMLNSPSLMSVLPNLQYLSNIPALTSKLSAIIPKIEKLQQIDFASINAVAEFIEPIIISTGSDYQVWKTTKDLLAYMQNITIPFNVETVDWSKLFTMAMPVVNEVSQGISNDSLNDLIGISSNRLLEEMYNLTTQLLNGSLLTEVSTGSLNTSLDMIETILRTVMSERDVNLFLLATDKMVEIMNEITTLYEDVEDSMENITAPGSAVANSLWKVFETGPNITLAFFKSMADPDNVAHLTKGDMGFKMICLKAVESLLMDEITRNTLRSHVCSDDVASDLESLISTMRIQDRNAQIEQLINEMTWIVSGSTNTTSTLLMKDLYFNIQNVYSRMTAVSANFGRMINTSFTSIMERNGINWMETEWEKLPAQYTSVVIQSNMFAIIQFIGPFLENTTVWPSIEPYLHTIDIVVQYMNDQIFFMKEMFESNSTMSRLISFTIYIPEFMESFLAEADDRQVMAEILSASNVTVLFCENKLMQRMNLSASVPVNDIEAFICTTNWEEFGQQLTSLFNIMPMISSIEHLFNESEVTGISSSYNWTTIVKNIERLSYLLQNSDKLMTEVPWYTVIQTNFPKMGKSLQNLIVKMEKKITARDLSDMTKIGLSTLGQLDLALKNVSMWTYLKHYFAAWNAYTKLTNSLVMNLRDNNFNLTDYITDLSPTLGKHLEEMIKKIPELINVMDLTARRPEHLLKSILKLDWSRLCNGTFIGDIFVSDLGMNLKDFEDGLCTLNWTRITNELLTSDVNVKQYSVQLMYLAMSITEVPDITVNWTELVQTTILYLDNMINLSISSYWPTMEFLDLNIDNISMSWNNFVYFWNMSDQPYINRLTSMTDEMMTLLDMLDNSSSPLVVQYKEMVSMETYLVHHIMLFYIEQLKFFNRSVDVNILQYLNSKELNKIVRSQNNSLELNYIIAYNVLNLITNPQKISTMLTTNFSTVCEDVTTLGIILSLPPNSALDLYTLQSIICGVNINYTALLDDLSNSLPRFKEMVNAFANVLDRKFDAQSMHINFTTIMEDYNQITMLWNDIRASPPNITLGWSESAIDSLLLQRQWDDMIHKLTESLSGYNLFKIIEASSNLLSELDHNFPEFSKELKQIEFIYRILDIVLDKLDQLTNDSYFNLDDFFMNSTEVRKVMLLIQKDGVLEVLLNSAISLKFGELLMNPNATEVVVTICKADLGSYISVPSPVVLNLTSLQQEFCDINITKFVTELLEEFKIVELTDALQINTSVDWKLINSQYARIISRINRWLKNPPTFSIPLRWQNERFWYQMLISYSESRMDPTNIVKEVQSFLQLLEPLKRQEPMRQFGLFLETFLALANRNLIAVKLTNLTLDDLATSIPVLRDIFNSLELRPDVLDSILTAPIRDQKLFIELFTSLDIVSELCSNGLFWDSTFNISHVNTTEVQNAFCKLKNSSKIDSLLRGLNFTLFLKGMNDTSIIPDWKAIITESMELSNIVSSLINNSDIGFNLLQTLSRLKSTYNTSNLLNLLSLYTALNNYATRNDSNNIIGSGNWEMFSGIVQGIETIVKVIDNVIRQMNPTDGGIQLSLLFANTSHIRNLLESLPNINEDFINSLLMARIKPGMESKILELISNTTNMAEGICNEGGLLDNFEFLPTFNTSMMVQTLCKANGSRIIEELMELLDISKIIQQFSGHWKRSGDYNIHNFVQLIQDLSDTFLNVVNATNIDLGSFTALLNLNVTKLDNLFMAELDNLAMKYPNIYSQLLEPLFNSLLRDETIPSDFVLVMQIISTWTKEFHTRLSELMQAPINISTLLINTELSKVLRIVLTRPDLIADLMNVDIIEPAKLGDIISNIPDSKSVFCGGNITDILTAPANNSFWLLYEDLCAINGTLLFWESLSAFTLQYRQIQLLELLVQTKNELRLNVTGITQYSTQLVEMLMMLLTAGSQNNKTMTSSNLFNISYFQHSFEILRLSLSRQFEALIQKWSSIVLQFLGQVPNADVSKSIMTFEVILKFINRQLMDLQGNITIDKLLRGDTDLHNMLESFAKLNNIGTRELLMNGSISIDALLQLVKSGLMIGLCKNGTLAEFITKNGTHSSVADDLEKIICVYPEPFWQALQNRTDANILEQQLSNIWNDTYTGVPDWVSLSTTIDKFSTLISGLLSNPIYVDDKMINLLNFNMSLESALLFFHDPARMFDALSQFGSVLNYTWLNPVISSFDTSVRFMMGFLKEFQASGKSLEELLMDPHILSKLMLMLTSFDDQLRIFADSYTKSILEIAGGIDFYQRLVCNVTLMNMVAEKNAPLSMHMSVLSNALCQRNASDWYNNLVSAGFSQTDIIKFFTQLIESNSTLASEKLMAPPSWKDFVNLVRELANTLSGSQLGNLSNVFHMDMNWLDYLQLDMINNSLSSFFNIVKLIDSGTSTPDTTTLLHDLRRFFKVFGAIEQYVNKQLDIISTMGWNVPLSILLPNSTLIAQLLTDAIGAQSASALLTATIQPEKFVILALSNNWKNVVCNETEFSLTFMFPVGINVSSLQKDLCENTLSHESAIGELLQKVDMIQVLSELNNWMSMKSNISSSNDTNTWDNISRQTVILVDYVHLLLEKGSSNFSKWLEPIMLALDKLNSPSINSLGQVCDRTLQYLEGMDYYDLNVLPSVEVIYHAIRAVQMQMALLDVTADVVCDDTSQNLTNVIQQLKANGVLYKLKELVNIYTGSMSGSSFTCASMIQYSNEINTLFSKSLTQWMNQSAGIEKCVTETYMASGEFVQNVQRLFSTGGELLQILNDPDFVKISKIMESNDQLVSIMEYVIRAFLQQQKVTEEIRQNIKNNITSIEGFFQQTLQLTTVALYSMMNATFGVDLKNLTENITADAIAAVLCDPDNLKKVVKLPDFINVSYNELSSQLCGQDIKSTSQIAAKLAELAILAQKLQYLQKFESSWWNDVMNDLSTFIKDIQGLSDLVGLLNQITLIDFNNIGNSRTLLSTIQRLLVDSGPDDLIQSFNALLKHFGQLSPDNVTMDIFADVQMLTKGLLGLKTIRSFVISNIAIADLIKDQDELKTFLMKELGLSKTVVDAVTNGALSFEMMITKGFTSFFMNAGVTPNDSRNAVGKIIAAQDDFKVMLNIVNNQTSFNASFIATLAQAQIGEEALSVSSLLCGSGDSSVDDSFNLNMAIGNGNDASTLTDSQVDEMMTLPGEFCRNLYKDIMKTDGGPIIWGYLKPLVRGKILYTPDTNITRRIVQKINDTFEMLGSVHMIAKQWAAGSESLTNLYGSKEDQNQLKKLFSDRFIQSLMVKITGIAADELQNSLYAFSNTDPLLIKSLSNAARLIENYTSCLEMDRFIHVASEDQMNKEGVKLNNKNEFLAGLVFINVEDMSTGRRKRQITTDIPKHMQYKLRMDIDNVQHTERLKEWFWRPIPEDSFEEDLRYLRGFVQLQDMIERAIISLQIGQDVIHPGVSLKQFPFPCHKRDDYISVLSAYLLPIIMTIAWIAGVSIAARNLVFDREDGQEETLQAMGMRSYLNWWAWFLSTMIMMALVTLFVVIILRYGNIYMYTDFGILYLYILDFCFSTTMLCYFVSAFFTRTTMAMLTVLIVYLISYLPFIVLISVEVEMTFWQKTLACLSSTSAFGFSAQYLARYEEQLIGIQWSNIKSSPIHGDSTSFSWTCIMMVIDGAIYLVLGWYIRHVKPGKYGVSQPWYFLISPTFWGCTCSSSIDKYRTRNVRNGYLRESVDQGLREALSARGLTKVYSKKQGAAVDDVDMSIYSGHVTVMLGENGAAKTTLINMLIGILKPSQGEVLIYNRPQQKMKHSLGICPQYNSLFPYMTVIEHMEFYAAIKSNRSGTVVKDEVKQLLQDVDLWCVRHALVKHLSGGMKRRLCVALAFVGGSEVVILDEPTSGIDPNGRRAIWNLIVSRKNGCAVLLSTHHLDEADILGDRIILMHKGKILCSGSPLFLKQSVGSGYRLTLTRNLHNEDHNIPSILTWLQARVPNAKLVKVVNNEYTFILPIQSQYNEFERLFLDLDTQKETLDISEYALSGPTLDEVFLKVSFVANMGQPLTPENISAATDDVLKSLDWKEKGDDGKNEAQHKVTTINVERSQRKPSKSTGCALKSQQLRALISKRFHHYRRDWRMIVSVLLLPIAMFAAALGFHTIRPDDSQARNLLLTPPMYGPNSYVFVSDPVQDSLTSRVMDMFIKDPGIGTTCMKIKETLGFPFECIESDSAFTVPSYTGRPNATCKCDDYQYLCDEGAAGKPPPQKSTITTDILQDLSGYDIEKYLLDSFFNFMENRYGGWSFETSTDSMSTSTLTAKVWFNNKGHHAMPAFVNALNNAILRANVDLNVLGNPAEYGVTAYNHPFTFNRVQLSRETILQNASDMGISLIIIFAFTCVPLGLILFVINEMSNMERHLQRVGGVGTFMYWITSLIWDLVMYSLTVALVFALLAIFRLNSFWARENAAAVIVLLLLYGWALLPMMYTVSKLFKEGSTAYFTMFCINIFIAISTLVCIFLLNFFQSSLVIKNAYSIVKYVFLIFPPYCLGEGLIKLTENQIQSEIFARFGTDSYKSPFSFDLIAWNLVAMAIEGFVFFIILFFSEARCEFTRSVASLTSHERSKEDNDVSQERLRVQTGYSRGEVLVVNDLSKVFKRNGISFFAVDHISFGVPKGQCFGLLGFNGAGKTTTFRMLTGDITPSGGIAQVLHKTIRHCDSSIGVNIGYCPQVDALDKFLTVSELLYCHASLKGIPAPHIKMAVEKVMSSLQLKPIANKVIKACSGGMKRKVSLAIALIGDPPVILLDEPTTGMDPASKRLTWNCLQETLENGQSIILTSHSMDECDILCGKLAIMVNGQLKCLGSPQRLKYKFGEGYTVKLYMSDFSTSQDRLYEFISTYFPGAMKRSHHQNVVEFDIPRETASISQIFKALETEKHNYNIIYYTVSQTTLETIFLNIARYQGDRCFPMDGESSSLSDGSEVFTSSADPLIGKKYGYINSTYDGVDDVQFHPKNDPEFIMLEPSNYTIQNGYKYSTKL